MPLTGLSHVEEAPTPEDDYGEYVRVETPNGYVYIWSCGCCGLTVQEEPFEGVEFSESRPQGLTG